MIRARKKSIALITALVFMLTMIAPMAAFGDDADISGSYVYVTPDKKTPCGSVTVKNDEGEGHEAVVIKLSLPSDVKFNSTPAANSGWYSVTGDVYNAVVVDRGSRYWEIELSTTGAYKATFDFAHNDAQLNIDKDFAGNLDVDVEVIGLDEDGSIVWTETKSVTIAKVAEGDVVVDVDNPKKVSMGSGKSVADITLEESAGAVFSNGEVITLEIATDGVEFNSMNINPARLDLKYAVVDEDETDKPADADSDWEDTLPSVEGKTMVFVKVVGPTNNLPGKISFEDIKVSVAPDVTGDIEISITSDGDADISEDVVVATVGDVTAEVSDIEDNDSIAWAGQETKLDVEFTIETTDDSDFDDEIITFELSQGTIVDLKYSGAVTSDPKLYKDDEAFYVNVDGDDEFTISDIKVALDNDAEPGDLVLKVGGDYELGDIVIGKVAKPYTVTADKPVILAEALNQAAGDLYITETEAGAFVKEEFIKIEVPAGIEFAKKPSVEVTEGTADVKIAKYEDDYIILEITKESGSKPSVIRVYNIAYDTGKLALTGDVELKFSGDVKASGSDPYDFEDDSIMCTVANATVGDPNTVTATFTVGDEGVAVVNGRTLVQVNLLCDVLGLQKSWDAATKTAYFAKDGKVVAFPMGENAIYINGVKLPVDQGGMIINDFTYATLRGLQLAFGGTLDWDNDTKTATFVFNK